MAALYLLDDVDKVVFTFSPQTDARTWYLSRVSQFHRDNGKDLFVIRQAAAGSPTRWLLEDQSSGQTKVFGTPQDSGNGPAYMDKPSPPRGKWTVWGCPFTLTDEMPRYVAISSPCTTEVPFASMHYREEGNVAYLELLMRNALITDDKLEECLAELRRILVNLARRPEMVLMIRSDGRETSAVPAWRQIRRFLSFIQQEVGTECVLVGRGSAIILVPSGFLGRALLGVVQFVQRILPAPYPQTIVPTEEEADKFLAELAAEARLTVPPASLPAQEYGNPDSNTEHLMSRENSVEQTAADAAPSIKHAALERTPSLPAAPAQLAGEAAVAKEAEPPLLRPERQSDHRDFLNDHLEGPPAPSRAGNSWFCLC
eukprot:TRINITY_DN55731_c0_g1_i1.p1 TRINITY_DN55731_c0_g1~~TRINITY_DN55731_c0_g1_i1.p1  ORF type:complete len:371 (+),score=54.72 TRINITY_DN55731_c0_g1_i1:105-1217(+)